MATQTSLTQFQASSTIHPRALTVVGITDPAFGEFLRRVVRSIARATRRSVRLSARWRRTLGNWWEQQLIQSAEIDRRQRQLVQEQYFKHFCKLRSLL